jgi:hypothetical protein
MVPGIFEIDGEPGFDLQDRAILTSESKILEPRWHRAIAAIAGDRACCILAYSRKAS